MTSPHPHKEGEGQGVGASGSAVVPGTALPWAHDSGPSLRGRYHAVVGDYDDEPMVCELYDGTDAQREANARYIVHAANLYPELLNAAQDAEWALEGIVEDEELGDECPCLDGFDLCGAKCCEHSGCAVERLARVRAAIARARGEAQ